jgi:hypothetical protein
MIFCLTSEEIKTCSEIGKLRNDEAKRLGGVNQHGLEDDPGDLFSINGVAGEIIFRKAKQLSVPLTINTFRTKPDFLKDIEIKTLSLHWYGLWVRPNDNPDYRFVLVTGSLPNPCFDVQGWAYGHEVIKNNYSTNFGNGRPNVWLLEQTKLRPFETLEIKQ